MISAPQQKLTPEEYLAREHHALERSEYVDGVVRAMGGAGFNHNAIVANMLREFTLRLRGKPCRVMAADMRVKSGISDNYFYPDIVGYCGPAQLQKNVTDTLLNPVLLLEVLFPSTEAYDRGEKFFHYQQITALQQYVLVSQAHPRVEIFTRGQGGRWEYEVVSDLSGTVRFSSLDVELSLAEIYRDVDFARVPEGQR